MTMELAKQTRYLPATIEDLSKFVLVGRERLRSVSATIRAIDTFDLGKEVREQKKEEAQVLAEALLDAETRIGELLRDMPRTKKLMTESHSGLILGTLLPEGITRNQSSQFQKMAAHKDVIEQVKAEARKNDELPTMAAVLEAIKSIE